MAEQLTQISGNTITSSDLSIVFSLANILGPVTMIFGGSFNDRVGPSKVMLVGGVLFGSGLIVSGFAQSVGVLILGYSMLCGLGMSLVYGCTIGNSVKFFPDNRGLAGGLATASYGLSSVLLPIVSNALIQSVGIRSTFKILGAVFMAVIVIGSRFILHCPTDFCPEGWKPDTRPGLAPAHVEKTWRQMLSDPLFYYCWHSLHLVPVQA
jgi:MFS family permease